MKKTTSKQKLENYYQINIPAETYSYLLILDNATDKSVVEFVEEYCNREFDVIYKGQSNTVIGRRKKRYGKREA